MRHTWRVDAPQHAINHLFLMHEILAFSALHKAHKLPEQRAQYYAFGIHHQDLAIRGVREKLQNVTAHEAAAIVATSTLLTLSVFASTGFEMNCPDIASSQGAIDGVLNIFNLMQGMGNVLQLAQVHVLNSFLSPMQVLHSNLACMYTHCDPRFRDPEEAIPSQPMLQELINQLPTLIAFVNASSDLSEPERACYFDVIGHFEPCLHVAMPPKVDNRELRFLFFWPLHLQPNFLTYMRQRHSGALAITMYYATMLFAAQSRYWFMDSWGENLMRACFEDLEEGWLPAVQWPASFINHQPTYSLFANLAKLRQSSGTASQPPKTGYPQRRPVEVPYMEYVDRALHGSGTQPNMVPDPRLTAVQEAQHHRKADATLYAKRPGPAEDAA
jgi:hypothetical protein